MFFSRSNNLIMHVLFNSVSPVNQALLKFPEWGWVREALKRNVSSVIGYYRQHPRAVKSDHFLVRLLGSVSVSKYQNLERYYAQVDAIALNLSMALKMTSSIYGGFVFDGVFYGPGTSEILIAHNASFDFEEAHENWQNVEAVKVLRLPRSDLGINLPNGHASGTETGLAVIAINVTLLAVQYRAFVLAENEFHQNDDDSRRSLMHFVHMYVLPNMLWSQTDQVMFNRVDRLSRGQDFGQSHENHPFLLPMQAPEERTNEVYRKVLQSFEDIGRNFTGQLRMIPAIYKDDMEQVMLLPGMAQTRQVIWALTIARLPMLSFLFRNAKWGTQMRDRAQVNAIERSMLAYRQAHLMQQYLPRGLALQVQNEIDEILQAE